MWQVIFLLYKGLKVKSSFFHSLKSIEFSAKINGLLKFATSCQVITHNVCELLRRSLAKLLFTDLICMSGFLFMRLCYRFRSNSVSLNFY